MREKFFLKAVIIIIAVLSGVGCGGNNAYPSVSSVSVLWLEIKQDLYSDSASVDLNSYELISQIDDFHFTLNRFWESPVGTIYRIRLPEEMRFPANVDSAVNRLKIGVEQGDAPLILLTALEIDSSLQQMQLIDNNFSDTSQLHYFMLFFFFTLLVIGIILVLSTLHSRLVKAENREQQSLAFSRETVAAQEEERSRIARELHDTVAQDLWRLSFQTDTIDKIQDSAERRRLCAEVTNGQKELMRRIRSICDNLIPPDFMRRSLGDALRSLCHYFEQRTKIECQLTVQNDLQSGVLDSDTQLQCYRIVQECLTNIEKHAEATEVSVLYRSGDEIIICVSDNGKGFSPPDRDSSGLLRAQGHFGLWGMYERAAALNGILTLDSEVGESSAETDHSRGVRRGSPPEGTVVTLRLPLNIRKHT